MTISTAKRQGMARNSRRLLGLLLAAFDPWAQSWLRGAQGTNR